MIKRLAGLAKYSMDPYQSAHLRWSFDSHPGKNQQLRELYFFCNEMETGKYFFEYCFIFQIT